MQRRESAEKGVRKPAVWTREKALDALSGLCARAEQCESDLRTKMRNHGLNGPDADAVIDRLVEMKFLDEERYARAYARDKVRFNGWGRLKVGLMLRAKSLPAYAIKDALAAIDEQEYYSVLLRVARTAGRSLQLETYADRAKLMRRLYARGFEIALIRDAVDDVRKSREE